MTQPTQLAVEIDLLYDLAKTIKERFMPTVFTCACNGEAEDCKRALNDGRVWERRETITQITTMLQDMAKDREDQHSESEQ